MSKLLKNEMGSMTNEFLAETLQNNYTEILLRWKACQSVQTVLYSKGIDLDFFIKHFGSRVLNYFIAVLRGEQKAGQCPVIMVMLNFFSRHNLKIDEIYKICAGKRNSVIHTLIISDSDRIHDLVGFASRLFDENFAGVIREYTNLIYGVRNDDNCAAEYACTSNKENITTLNQGLLEEYFSTDKDEENRVLFRNDDADDLMEYFGEVSERLSLAAIHSDPKEILAVSNIFAHTSSILLHYSPYLDTLSASMSELSVAMDEHSEAFMEVLKSSENGILRLFDAVSSDMDRYIERFCVESMAMKNAHHIHEPTTLSIRQIITMFSPDLVDEGEIEFF